MRSDRAKHFVLVLMVAAATALLSSHAIAQTSGDCPSGPTRVTLAPQEAPCTPLRPSVWQPSVRLALAAALSEWQSPVFGHISIRVLPFVIREPRGLTR